MTDLGAQSYLAHLREHGRISDDSWPRSLVVALGVGAPARASHLIGRLARRPRERATPFGELRVRGTTGVLNTSLVGSASMAVLVAVLGELGVEQVMIVGRCGALTGDLEVGSTHRVWAVECRDGASRDHGAYGRLLLDQDRQPESAARPLISCTTDSPFMLDELARTELLRRGVDVVEMELAGAAAVGREVGVGVRSSLVVSDVRDENGWRGGDPSVVDDSLRAAVRGGLDRLAEAR